MEAKANRSVDEELSKLSQEQRDSVNQRMLQALLADRFKLTLHRETKDLPVYSLVVADAGKLHAAVGDCDPSSSLPQPVPEPGKLAPPLAPPCGHLIISLPANPGSLSVVGQKVPIAELATYLSDFTGREVLDKAGLAGKYDIDLKWTPAPGPSPTPATGAPNGVRQVPHLDANLLTAVQEQLGLKLEPQIGPVELLVIDHVEKPSEN